MNTARQPSPTHLADLGQLVTVQYPDRPDMALIAALRLLALTSPSPTTTVAYVHGALLTRRAAFALQSPLVPTSTAEAMNLSDTTGGGILLIGTPEPAIVLVQDGHVLDLSTTYRIEDLGLPFRVLHGPAEPSLEMPGHTLAQYPYGLTAVYVTSRRESPLAAGRRLISEQSPLMRRRIEHDVRKLEPAWRQLRHTA